MHPSARRAARSDRLPLATALLGVGLPVVIDLAVSGSRRAFGYLAADAFYYLEVAKNIAERGRVSFDGTRPTNGFHPLWQITESGLWWVCNAIGLSEGHILVVVVLCGLALICVALVLLAEALRRAFGRIPPLFALAPVGLYALLLLPVWVSSGLLDRADNELEGSMPLYGTLWSCANGMETPLVVLIYALALLAFIKLPALDRRATVIMGALLSLLLLARLDLLAVAGSYCAVILVLGAALRSRSLLTHSVGVGSIVTAVLAVYAIVNRWYADAWLPVSGTLKSSFPHPIESNLRALEGLYTGHYDFYSRVHLYRFGPILIGSTVALLWLATRGRLQWKLARAQTLEIGQPLERLELLLTATAGAVLTISVYDLVFVPHSQQGHWYWPVTTLFVTLAGLDCVHRRTARTRPFVRPARRRALSAAVLTAGSLIVFGLFGRPANYHARWADMFVAGSPAVHAAFAGQPEPLLLTVDDGLDAFALGYPSMSGSGLNLDAEGVDAFKSGQLVRLALARGFDLISSSTYFDATGLTVTSSPEEVARRVAVLFPEQDLSGLVFTVVYTSEPGLLRTPWPGSDGTIALIRVSERG